MRQRESGRNQGHKQQQQSLVCCRKDNERLWYSRGGSVLGGETSAKTVWKRCSVRSEKTPIVQSKPPNLLAVCKCGNSFIVSNVHTVPVEDHSFALYWACVGFYKSKKARIIRDPNTKISQILSGMIQIQKTTSAVAEESLCDNSVTSTSNHSQESATGKTTNSLNSVDSNRVKSIQVEELNVIRARRLVGLGFAVCAIAVSTGVFTFARRSDKRAFEVEVRKDAATTFHSLRIGMTYMVIQLIRNYCAAFVPINLSTMDSPRTS
jgi:hypothetical protein